MKTVVILGDGMADEPSDMLDGCTPLMAADTPYIDHIASFGTCGLIQTIPQGFPAGSEIANLVILGHDVKEVFEGRGVLEAASMGVQIKDGEVGFRCNLICIEDEKIKNHSAGHISTDESCQLIATLQEKLGSSNISFHTGISFRHLLVLSNADKRVKCTPPHDVPGIDFKEVLVKAERVESELTANLLNKLILDSMKILNDHQVNVDRIRQGKDAANAIWPWSPGNKPKMKTLEEMFNIQAAAVISAVDLIKGIGVYSGMDVIKVDGATGLHDTNYEGKAEAALNALSDHDFLYLHIEAPDEAGHEGNVQLKIKTIEDIDRRIVQPIIKGLEQISEPVTVAVLPDHPTPCTLKTHTSDPVPFAIYKPNCAPDKVIEFNERSCASGFYGNIEGNQFMQLLLEN